MNLKQLLNDDRAVSPVIGVILMVAITVILAAVIGTFVLGLGDQVSTTTPSASMQFDYTNNANDDVLEIAHAGGDTIQASQLNISISGSTSAVNGNYLWSDLGSAGDVNAGSTATISNSTLQTAYSNYDPANDSAHLNNATVRVIWSASSGDSSSILGKWTGPDAN